MKHKRNHTITLIISLSVIVVFSVIFSQIQYKNTNASVDPRVVNARELYQFYNTYSRQNNLDSVFILMDSIESIYATIDHYKDAFEIGVLDNNRAAAWLTIALYSEFRDSTEKDSIIGLAEEAARKSISCHEEWKASFGSLSKEDIKKKISDSFVPGLAKYSPEDQEKYLNNRIEEIIESQVEIDRRLSVSLTNLGIVYRYRTLYDSAATCYVKALELWDRNYTAEDNLNLLLGNPIKKRNAIQRLLPPDRI
ncbi:hypothetical protein ACFLT1_02205 [Bacteroidota bacterium]